jgi:hypothetical protein
MTGQAPQDCYRSLWISSELMTGLVGIDSKEIIMTTPPVWRVFRYRHINELLRWLDKRIGAVEVKELPC